MNKPIDPARIRELRVLPPLGLARVGNCADPADPFADDYLISPETIGGPPFKLDGSPAVTVDDYRGDDGAIRRHAARFRVYATLDDGSVTELVHADGIEIEWRVAVANLKAGWYDFENAMDLPADVAKNAGRRNRDMPVMPGGRRSLDIVPQPRMISGSDCKGAQYAFKDGQFFYQEVYLGELRTDAEGRLLILGGRGLSGSYPPNRRPITFANNEGWHDDVSDGPVHATVRFPDGTTKEAEPGFVAVTPPNYGPGITGLVTMDDAVREVFMDEGWLPRPASTSFTQDIWPIFKRLTDMQWVNQGLFMVHGHQGPLDVGTAEVLARLRDARPAGAAWRQRIFSTFREAQDIKAPDIGQLPQIYGDAEAEVADPACLSVTATQYGHLTRWAAGDFVDDWQGEPALPDFGSLTSAQQVEHLERAALHDCLGGPFHPGIELTWTMRIPHVWQGAYRLNVLPGDGPARQDFGDTLTPAVCTGKGGPYDGLAAGALTRFMGVPWQTDGASCNSAADYSPSTFLSMPSFWGARVPDQVLSSESFDRVVKNAGAGQPGQAGKYFALRSDWLRDVRKTSYYGRIKSMIEEWHKLGMVLPATHAPAGFPGPARVEQGRSPDYPGTDPKLHLLDQLEGFAPEPAPTLKVKTATFAAEVAPAPTLHVPPLRTYRQGEV